MKYYGGKKHFMNLSALVHAEDEWIDLMRVGNKYAINATHFGFDSCVAQTMMNVRRKKIIGGKNAYTTGVIVGLFKAMKNDCTVSVDGEVVNPEGKIVSYEVSAGNVGRNADELFRKLQACQFVYEHGDEVCPAKWQPGAETLKPSLDLVGML